jgi:hypothetical protein
MVKADLSGQKYPSSEKGNCENDLTVAASR